MAAPVLSLLNGNYWNNLYYQNFQAMPGTFPNSYVPIPVIDLPILISEHILAAHFISAEAKINWWLGGKITPLIDVPGVGLTQLQEFRCQVNRKTLIIFEKLTNEYQLRVTVPYWYQSMQVVVWGYHGPESDTITEKLNEIEQKLETILP